MRFAYFRRRRKRREQPADGKGDKPQNYNLPQIPHCYSTAASYAASSLSHRFSNDSSSSYNNDLQMRREEEGSLSYDTSHSSPISSSEPSNPIPVDLHLQQSSEMSLHDASDPLQPHQDTLQQKSPRLHDIQQAEAQSLGYQTPQPDAASATGESRITQAVTSSILPDFRAATSQSHFEASRYANTSNIATYSPSIIPQATTAHYTGHYSIYGPSFPATTASLGSPTQYNSQMVPQLPSQRPLNFSVNHLIQRQYPKM